MKNLLFCFVLFSTGCLIYEQPSYPSLDGTYVLNCVTIECVELDFYDEYCENTTVVTQNPSTPLDTLKINKTKIHISGSEIYLRDYVVNGVLEWQESYFIQIQQDLITGRWSHMRIMYDFTYPRNYTITEDGLEYLVLSFTQETNNYETYNYTLTFRRQGP